MRTTVSRRLFAFPLAALLLLAVSAAWQAAHPVRAAADVTQTTDVSGGPGTFTQAVPTGNPSDYGGQLERCSHSPSYPLSGTNPILSEAPNTKFTSNVPLKVHVVFNGNQWYGLYQLVFTNTSTKQMSPDCAVIIFRAPSHSDQHYYLNQEPTGHPQSDDVEVPVGDGTSWYIIRLGFHDVNLAQRTAFPNETFTWQEGAAPAAGLTLEQIRDSIRFYADLNLASNTSLVQHYGTTRFSN
jgi:hypothetical protein